MVFNKKNISKIKFFLCIFTFFCIIKRKCVKYDVISSEVTKKLGRGSLLRSLDSFFCKLRHANFVCKGLFFSVASSEISACFLLLWSVKVSAFLAFFLRRVAVFFSVCTDIRKKLLSLLSRS